MFSDGVSKMYRKCVGEVFFFFFLVGRKLFSLIVLVWTDIKVFRYMLGLNEEEQVIKHDVSNWW
jgi:hypothetical protein